MGIYECYQDIQEKAQTEKIKNKQFFATFIKAGSYLQQLAGVFICIYKKLHTKDFGQDCAHVHTSEVHMEPPSQNIDGKLFHTSRLNMQSYVKAGHLLL